MAGLHRRKFVEIISDKFTDHYRGKIAEAILSESLKELAALVGRLEEIRVAQKRQRGDVMRKLKKLPLEVLQTISQ